MEFAAWLGLAEARPIDAISLAFFADALIPAPFPGDRAVRPRADDRPHDPLPRRPAANARPGSARAVPGARQSRA